MEEKIAKIPSLKAQSVWLLFAKIVGFALSFLLPFLVVRILSQEKVGIYKQVFLVVGNAIAILPLGISMSAYYFLSREKEERQAATILNILIFNFAAGGIAFFTCQILEKTAKMKAEGLGKVKIHLHHGVEKPDTAENIRKSLIEFRDILAEDHKCLSRFDKTDIPRYAFVHGNLAFGNSCGGRFCGVDEEMRILHETGCCVDMTLPSAPDQSQVQIV